MAHAPTTFRIEHALLIAVLLPLFWVAHHGLPITEWVDSQRFEALWGTVPGSREFWRPLEHQPATVPLLYWLVGSPAAVAVLQKALSFAAWIFFALSVAPRSGKRWMDAALFVLLAAGMFDRNVLCWNHVLLSESVTLSAMVGFTGLLARLHRTWSLGGPTPLWLAAAVVLGAAITVDVKELTAVWILCSAAWIAAAGLFHKRALAGAALAVILAGLAARELASTDGSWKGSFVLGNIITKRILTDDAKAAFFYDRGLPREACLQDKAGEFCRPGEARDILNRYYYRGGKEAYTEFLLRHPGYALAAPWRRRPSLFDLDLAFYGTDGPHSRYVGGIHARNGLRRAVETATTPRGPMLWILAACGTAAALYLARHSASDARRRLWLPSFLLASGLLVFYTAYHADAMEDGRHCLPGVVAVELSFLTAFASAAATLVAATNPYGRTARSGASDFL